MTEEKIVKRSFDLPQSLNAALVAQAEREDNDVAKIIRRALRKELGIIDQPAAPAPSTETVQQ